MDPMGDESPVRQVADALRRERQRSGLSLSEAAKRAGIGKSTLSQLEGGQGNPSLETMWSLATAYDIALSRLLDPPTASVSVIRSGEAPLLASSNTDYVAALLSSGSANVRRDLYLISANPGPIRDSQPHPVGTVEHVVIGRGRARMLAGGQETELGPGDYMSYPGDEVHQFEALEPDTLVVFVVDSY